MKDGPDEIGNWAYLNGTQHAPLTCLQHMFYASIFGLFLGVCLGAAIAEDWLWIGLTALGMSVTVWKWHREAHRGENAN